MKELLRLLVIRVSRKAILLTIAMILIYLIVLTPNAVHAVIAIWFISILALSGSILQFFLDKSSTKEIEDGTEESTKETKQVDQG
jgi:ABC-type bacteriocin/lantibiotic exporter with double-glycine peptidase domain